MAKRSLNGESCTYENQDGVMVIDLKQEDGRTLRFIFEDSWTYMVAVLDATGEVIKTDSVDVDRVVEQMTPPPRDATDSDMDHQQ